MADEINGQSVTYDNTDGTVDVRVRQTREHEGMTQTREYVKDYHKDADAPKRALKFTYEIESGEARLDDILPDWDGGYARKLDSE